MVDPNVTGPPITSLTRTRQLAVQGACNGLAARTRRHVSARPSVSRSSSMPATIA